MAGLFKEKRREASGTIIYFMWGIWKEWNPRVFQNKALLSDAVVALIREELSQGPMPMHMTQEMLSILWACICQVRYK